MSLLLSNSNFTDISYSDVIIKINVELILFSLLF